MKKLQEALNILKEKPFPKFAEDDDLANWISDLAEMDSFVAGIAITRLGGQQQNYPTLKNDLLDIRNRLEFIQPILSEDKLIYEACNDYLLAIETVVNHL